MRAVISISGAEISETALQCQASSLKAGWADSLSSMFSLSDCSFLAFKRLQVPKNSSRANPKDYHWQLTRRAFACTVPRELPMLFTTYGKLEKGAGRWGKLKGHQFEGNTQTGISSALDMTFPQSLPEISIWMTGSWPNLSPGNTSEYGPGAVSDGSGVCLQIQASFTSPGSILPKPA